MSKQYLRRASLIVAGNDGDGLDLSELHFDFSTHQQNMQTPNSALIRIWNLSDKTSQRINDEFTRVILQVGYEGGDLGTIFDGTLVQVRRGRANATDTFLDLTAADGDEAYTLAYNSASFAAGITPDGQLKALAASMAKYDVKPGNVPDDFPSDGLPRGKVMHGMTRDYLRDLGETTDTKWSIQNGQLDVVAEDGYLPDEAVVLTAQTGLIGLPEQTEDGINVRCLLNPKLKPNGRIQIDNKSIQRASFNLAYKANQLPAPNIADDGFYRIVVIEHEGDTRGQNWYSNITCVAVDDTLRTNRFLDPKDAV